MLPHSDIFLLHRLFQARSRGGVQTKTFRKGSEASSRAERGRGYVILFSNEPSCCYAATSERRRIKLKADYQHYCSARSEHQALAVGQYLDRQVRLPPRAITPTSLLHFYLLLVLQNVHCTIFNSIIQAFCRYLL